MLAQAHAILQNSKFQVCNKTADEQVTVSWIAAVYHDGQRLRSFDSGRCPGWHPEGARAGRLGPAHLQLAAGGVQLGRAGDVLRDPLRPASPPIPKRPSREYNMAGRWQGFDRDCFTVQ